MGFSSVTKDPDSEEALLLSFGATTNTTRTLPPHPQIPKDYFHLLYIIYFTLGVGLLLPWNAFITAVDYFSYLYPEASVDRVFAIVYMLIGLICVILIVLYAHKSNTNLRINVGLVLFMVSMVAIPIMDLVYIKGKTGLYTGYYVTVAAIGLLQAAQSFSSELRF